MYIVRFYFWIFFILLFGFSSCKREGHRDDIVEKKNTPHSIKLSLNDSYTKNQLTGEKINPIEFKNKNFRTGKFYPLSEFIEKPSGKSIPIKGSLTPIVITNNKTKKNNLSILNFKENTPFTWKSLNAGYNADKLNFKKLTGKKHPFKLPKISHLLKPIFKDNAKYNIKYLDVEQGLNSSYTWCSYEDSKGQLWLGSNMGGLTMYNGEDLFDFSATNKCIGKYVWRIIEDSDHNIWIGTWGKGLIKFDGESFTEYNKATGFFTDEIQSLYEDSKGNIWVGSYAEGISVIYKNKFADIPEFVDFKDACIESIEEDNDGNIYLGTHKYGLIQIRPSGMYSMDVKGIDNKNLIMDIEFAQSINTLVFSINDIGVAFLKDKTLKILDESDGLLNNNIQNILCSSSDNLYLSFLREGIQVWNDENVLTLNDENGLSNATVLHMSSKDGKKIWLSTDGGGIDLLKLKSFKIMDNSIGIPSNHITCSAFLNDSIQLFGSEDYGIIFSQNNKYTCFKETKGLIVNKIYVDSQQNVWVATEKGILKLSNGQYQLWNMDNGLLDYKVKDIVEYDQNNIWIGTYEGGAYKINTNTYEVKILNKKVFGKNLGIWCSFKDSLGRINLGTWNNGLIQIQNDSLRVLSTNEGLSSNTIISIDEVYPYLFLGTNDEGVNILCKNEISYLNSDFGLPNNTVWDIHADKNDVWFGTEKGLAKINCKESFSESMETMVTFNSKEGLKGLDAYPHSLNIDQNGSLWFGSGKGLIYCSNDGLLNSISVPEIMFENLEINEQNYDFRNSETKDKFEYESILPFQNIPKNLSLRYDQNNLVLHFVGIDWENHENIQYSYRLIGVSDIWSNPKSEAKAEYKNLPPGDYIFELRARSKKNEWSKTISLEFSIDNPWWTSWWAKILYVVTTLLVLITIIYYRNRKTYLRRKKLEEEIRNATKEITQQKEEIEKTRDDKIKLSQRIIEQDKYILLNQTANTIAHELNSPLGIIKNGDLQLASYLDEILSQILPNFSQDVVLCCSDKAIVLS